MRLGSRTLAAALIGGTTLALPTLSSVIVPVDRECPIDGKQFEDVAEASGSVFCVRLDLRKGGYISDPPLLSECPTDRFVWYEDDFTPAEIDSVREWVRSKEYAALVAGESPHHRLAKIYERLGRDPLQIATAYRHAAWEVEERDPQKRRRDLRASLSHLLRANAQLDPSADPREREGRAILAGELERQVGDFEAARARFTALRDAGGFADETHGEIVRYELELISARDSDPHAAPWEGEDAYHCD